MENIEKGELITTGKAKSLYSSNEEDFLVMHYRDDTSAFDGKKIESLEGKGTINNKFNAFIMEYLEKEGIATHFEKLLSETDSLVKKLEMAPVECVVRNVAAGSICKRLGLEEGIDLNPPTFEFFYKDDELGDPMINEYHIKSFGWATEEQVEQMQEKTFLVNDSKSGSEALVISPASTTKLSLTRVSQATLESGSSFSIASNTASEI